MASLKPKNLHIQGSVEAAKTYHSMYPGSPAEEYVTARGLDDDVSARFALGYVHSALPGHERYRGHLAVPYMRPAGGVHGVATVRYRCIADECVKAPDGRYWFQHDQKEQHSSHGKYLTVPGDVPRLFNSGALIKKSPYVVLVEGEFDTMVWDSIGIPCVGAPGTGSWRDYWLPAFLGYKIVYLVAEDGPGENFMDDLAAKMPNGRTMRMADDMDSNQILLTYGAKALKERLSL